MTMRDIVMAQIRHEETDFVPYEFRADEDAEAMLTKHYGSEDWKKNVIEPFEKGPYFFDSWQVMKNIDPNDPTKKEDPFGCLWTITKEIAHVEFGSPGLCMADTERFLLAGTSGASEAVERFPDNGQIFSGGHGRGILGAHVAALWCGRRADSDR